MTKESVEYERFIVSLIEDVRNTGRIIKNLQHDQPLVGGETDQPHKIDVSFIDYSFPDPTLILIECKHWKAKGVDVSVPEVLSFKLDDILKNPAYPDCGKGIIVTTSHFQTGTERVADCKNIITQKVNAEPPYGFRYENIVLEAVKADLHMTDNAEIEVKRDGKLIDE